MGRLGRFKKLGALLTENYASTPRKITHATGRLSGSRFDIGVGTFAVWRVSIFDHHDGALLIFRCKSSMVIFKCDARKGDAAFKQAHAPAAMSSLWGFYILNMVDTYPFRTVRLILR